jgi:outer membrane protein assembly factor BamB
MSIPPALDSKRIYVCLAGGRVVCLNRESGSLVWSSDLGGIISGSIAVGEKALYIATHLIAEDRSEVGASLRAVDKETGLTLWVKDYSRAFTSPLTLVNERIYAGSADGAFYALSAVTGEVIWKVATQDVVRGPALVGERSVYFGGDDGGVRAVDAETGREVWKFQTGGRVPGRPCEDEQALYVGSADGYLYSIEKATGKQRWKARTGAAIEASPVIAQGLVIVGSFDNFVYCFGSSNGNRVWKRRLNGRVSAAAIIEGDSLLIAPLRGNQVAMLMVADGQPVNYFRLEPEQELVAQPLLSDGAVLLATDKGLLVAMASSSGNEPAAIKR